MTNVRPTFKTEYEANVGPTIVDFFGMMFIVLVQIMLDNIEVKHRLIEETTAVYSVHNLSKLDSGELPKGLLSSSTNNMQLRLLGTI